MTKTTVPLPVDKPKKSARTAKEELELKKRLRAEKIRAEKKVAKGDALPDDAREEILAAQELLLARQFEKELTMKRVREHLIEEEDAKVQVAEAWREEGEDRPGGIQACHARLPTGPPRAVWVLRRRG